MPGRTSPQSMFYSSVPSAEKPDRTTVPRARSTVLFPLQRNQTGPQSPEHVLQFCSLCRETRQECSVLFPLQRNQTGPQSPEHVLQFCSLIRKARRQQVELLALRCYIGKWSKYVRAYSCTMALHCEVVQVHESVLLHQGVTLWSGPSTWERTLAPRCYIVKWSKYVRAYSCTKVLHCEVVQVRDSVLLHQGVTLWSGPSTWYSCTKVLHCEVIQVRESVLLHQGVTLWSGPSTWERTLAPRCYIVKWSKYVRAYSCTKMLHCEVVQAHESILLHQGVAFFKYFNFLFLHVQVRESVLSGLESNLWFKKNFSQDLSVAFPPF